MNITLDDGRTELWQWDTGRKIVVDDKSVSEVHYSKYSSTQAITREVINGKAEIPNFLLQDTHSVTVYAYSGSIENGYTMAEKTFNVVKKPKPANYVETEEDKAILAKLKAAIGDLSELQTEAKDSLVSAINEAAASGGADWSQNDPDGDGYVKSRPGGYMTDPVITDVGTFTITSAEDMGGLYMAEVAVESSAITLSDYVIGDGVIVDFGGQSYILTWQSMEGFPACGAAVTGEAIDWSAAPFCIIAVFGGDGGLRGYYVYLQNAVTSPIQVKLTMAKQTPVKIPEKYLELDSAKEIVLFTISYNQSSKEYESDRTYDELVAALNDGKLVLSKFGNVGMGESYTYGCLYKRYMYVPGICVYVGGSIPYQWECTKGNKWTKRELLRLDTGYTTPKKAGTAAYGTSSWASRDDHVHPSELPDVSADDDGKLLGVTGGAWGKVDMPSGEDSEFVITGSLTEAGGITLDKTFAQIQEAVQAGKTALMRVDGGLTTITLPLAVKDSEISTEYDFSIGYFIYGRLNGVTVRVMESGPVLYTASMPTNNPDGTMPQVSMAAAPTSSMQIATKKYVDDHVTGGIDMGITGATVGQIAKITAVDASGTPTAWEPADMPSGGAITYDISATAERSVQNNTLQGFTCSVSSKQLRKAIDTGKMPRLVIKIRTTTMYMPMTNYFLVGAEYAYVNFGCVDEYGLENVVCDGESEVDAGKPIWLASSSFVTPTY